MAYVGLLLGALLCFAACAEADPSPPPGRSDAAPSPGVEANQLRETSQSPSAVPVSAELLLGDGPVDLSFDEFYSGVSIREGLIVSDTLKALDGKRVRMEGYMAPPLKPELDFFVLTRIRLAFCPFCSSATDWPDDIAVIYLRDGTIRATERPIAVEGRLELGSKMDEETGMVSLVRVFADRVEKL